MDQQFKDQFEGLFQKYTELLTGQESPEAIEKVKIWSMYNHIHKTMPALTSHWVKEFPEAKTQVRQIFEEVKQWNNTKDEKK
ncbi:DUF2573 family protein [Longirhabdus pacifica]|uniref:DUF2573 family protein n=1 Tax=Longirhabdus pacifica TaxID=2305227 RepID=UPI0010090F64|nr:DUF2573 family protein [Longirhabdus pacifica]